MDVTVDVTVYMINTSHEFISKSVGRCWTCGYRCEDRSGYIGMRGANVHDNDGPAGTQYPRELSADVPIAYWR